MEATQGYRAEQDRLGTFLDEHTVIGPEYRARASELYARYRQWGETGREPLMSQTAFGLELVERGFEKRTPKVVWYHGIGLRDIPSEASEGCDPFSVSPAHIRERADYTEKASATLGPSDNGDGWPPAASNGAGYPGREVFEV